MAVSPDPSLGQVLLEQKPNRGNIGNGCFLFCLGLPMVCVLAAPTAPLGVRLGFFTFGLALSTFSLVMLWRNWMYVFLQERGIREYRRGKGRSLAYDEVDELIYSSGRIFMHGSYIHTVQKLALRSEQMEGPPLVCTLIFKEADGRAPAETPTALTRVRDAVSMILGERIHKRIRGEETIPWAPQVRISRYGVEIEERGGWEMVEWRQVTRLEADQGTLHVWTQNESKPRLKLTMAEPNFYPILAVVQKLMRESRPR